MSTVFTGEKAPEVRTLAKGAYHPVVSSARLVSMADQLLADVPGV